eukprot:TRINITY_DN26049_c0_g1_i1.p1 TRINITY_DN26049_c0_g1~~TRINITY_DN26049_c0_g1_i1.p1  ORF type:complete len:415 (-),score=120.33 TRINITY_DN26049_c0_g1_i1:101-1345(-)
MAEEEELKRVSNLVIGIFRSPTWILPVAQFVDENCAIFENQEENKLEYTLVHNAFKQLVEDLLTVHMTELQVSTEEFTRFCQNGLAGSDNVHRSLVEQLISVDDFLVFKAMMLKRNSELGREALNPIGTIVIAAEPLEAAPAPPPPPPDQEGPPGETDAERLERLEAEQRCVEAELQLAIALSRHLEKRLQLIEALNEVLEMAAQLNARAESMNAEAEAEAATAAALAAAHLIQQQQEQCSLPATLHLQPLGHQPSLPPPPPEDPYAAEQRRADAAHQQERAERAVAEASAARQEAEHRRGNQQGPTQEERAARAEHLRRQREALMEKKKRQREIEIAQFQDMNGQSAATKAAERVCAGLQPSSPSEAGKRLADELRGLPEAPAAPQENPQAAAVEMRRALTAQLKQSLTMSLQ